MQPQPEGLSALSVWRPATSALTVGKGEGRTQKEGAGGAELRELLEKLSTRLETLNTSVAALDRRVDRIERLHQS